MGIGSLGWTDYGVIACSLLFCVVIGLRAGHISNRKKKKGQDADQDKVSEFLLAGRRLGMIPAAFSIMATIFSSNSIAGNIGEIYVYGITNCFYFFGATLVKIFAAYYIIPVFHNIPYVSIYEYLERRFDRTLRVVFAILYMLCNYIFVGTVLYGPAISLTLLTGIPYWVNALLLGFVCTLYCVLGGMKAVVWTDVFQALLMFACVLMLATQALLVAGIGNVFEITAPLMAQHIILEERMGTRYSLWGLMLSSTLATFKTTIAGQAGAQRLLAVKDHHVARRSVYLSCAMMILFDFITMVCAMSIYFLFASCDPLQRKEETGVETPDQVFIYAVSELVGSIPGLQGLAMAGLLSASLSTCSSYINSFATIVLQDFFKVFFPGKTLNQNTNIRICKVLTVFFGALAVLVSFAVPFMGGIVKVTKGVAGAVMGPLSGIMFTAFFCPRVNATAAKVALLVGIVLTTWVTVGSLFHPMRYSTLPLNLDSCPTSLLNATLSLEREEVWTYAVSEQTPATTAMPETPYVFPLYGISFVWYGPLGMAITCLLAIVISFFNGSSSYPDTRLLSPLIVNKRRKEKSQEETTTIQLEDFSNPLR